MPSNGLWLENPASLEAPFYRAFMIHWCRKYLKKALFGVFQSCNTFHVPNRFFWKVYFLSPHQVHRREHPTTKKITFTPSPGNTKVALIGFFLSMGLFLCLSNRLWLGNIITSMLHISKVSCFNALKRAMVGKPVPGKSDNQRVGISMPSNGLWLENDINCMKAMVARHVSMPSSGLWLENDGKHWLRYL